MTICAVVAFVIVDSVLGCRERDVKVCRMQENFVAEQLLQGPRHEWDDLLFIMHPVVGVSVVSTIGLLSGAVKTTTLAFQSTNNSK